MAATNQGTAWTPDEDEIVRIYFPEHGARGIKALGLLPNRTAKAITNRASDTNVEALEIAWPMPTHDYTPADRAFQAWRGPVNRAPLRGMA